MLTGISQAVIIHNPTTGRRRRHRLQDLEAARGILLEAGIHTTLQATSSRGAATELARQAIQQGKQLIIACGGDGTINEVANGMAGTQVPMAVLPAGTANVLAKELELPWDIAAAARLIPSGSLRRIALGLAISLAPPKSQRYFVCLAGAGPDGSMVRAVDDLVKQKTGILAYWFEGLRHLFVYPLPPFEARVGGDEQCMLQPTLVMVGRTKHYGGPFRITTNANLFEDSFEVALYTTRSRLRYLLFMPAVWLSLLRRMKDVAFLKTEKLFCAPTAPQTVYVQVDGEAAGRLPVEFRIVPDALTLVVPQDRPSRQAGA